MGVHFFFAEKKLNLKNNFFFTIITFEKHFFYIMSALKYFCTHDIFTYVDTSVFS